MLVLPGDTFFYPEEKIIKMYHSKKVLLASEVLKQNSGPSHMPEPRMK